MSLAAKLADREKLLDAIEIALYGGLYGADRADFLVRIEDLKAQIPVPEPSAWPWEGERVSVDEAVALVEKTLSIISDAPHAEHDGPLCPVCGLVSRLRGENFTENSQASPE